MSELQLSIRSTRARKLAHKLAKKEQRTVTQVVERALDHYALEDKAAEKPGETAAQFWERIRRDYGTDIDLEALINENRTPPRNIDL